MDGWMDGWSNVMMGKTEAEFAAVVMSVFHGKLWTLSVGFWTLNRLWLVPVVR